MWVSDSGVWLRWELLGCTPGMPWLFWTAVEHRPKKVPKNWDATNARWPFLFCSLYREPGVVYAPRKGAIACEKVRAHIVRQVALLLLPNMDLGEKANDCKGAAGTKRGWVLVAPANELARKQQAGKFFLLPLDFFSSTGTTPHLCHRYFLPHINLYKLNAKKYIFYLISVFLSFFGGVFCCFLV